MDVDVLGDSHGSISDSSCRLELGSCDGRGRVDDVLPDGDLVDEGGGEELTKDLELSGVGRSEFGREEGRGGGFGGGCAREGRSGDGGHLSSELVDLLHGLEVEKKKSESQRVVRRRGAETTKENETHLRSNVVLQAESLSSSVVLVGPDDGEHPEDITSSVSESVVDLRIDEE